MLNLSKYLKLGAGHFVHLVFGAIAGACLAISYLMSKLNLLQGATPADYEVANQLAENAMLVAMLFLGFSFLVIVCSTLTELKNLNLLNEKGAPAIKVEQESHQ